MAYNFRMKDVHETRLEYCMQMTGLSRKELMTRIIRASSIYQKNKFKLGFFHPSEIKQIETLQQLPLASGLSSWPTHYAEDYEKTAELMSEFSDLLKTPLEKTSTCKLIFNGIVKRAGKTFTPMLKHFTFKRN